MSLAEVLRKVGYEIPVLIDGPAIHHVEGGEYPLWTLEAYLMLPIAWKIFGKQFLVVGKDPNKRRVKVERAFQSGDYVKQREVVESVRRFGLTTPEAPETAAESTICHGAWTLTALALSFVVFGLGIWTALCTARIVIQTYSPVLFWDQWEVVKDLQETNGHVTSIPFLGPAQ